MNLFLGLYFPLFFSAVSAKQVMIEFHGIKNKQAGIQFIKKYKGAKSPSIQAYVIGAQLKQAEYSLNPLVKMSIYNKYKNKLNHLVTQHPKNAHGRYVRLLVQERVPKMLSCKDLIEEDKLFLKKYLLNHAATPSSLMKYIKFNTTL